MKIRKSAKAAVKGGRARAAGKAVARGRKGLVKKGKTLAVAKGRKIAVPKAKRAGLLGRTVGVRPTGAFKKAMNKKLYK